MPNDSDCAMLGPPPTAYQIMMAEQDIIDSHRADAWYEEQRRKMACRWCGTRGGEFCSSKCRERWQAHHLLQALERLGGAEVIRQLAAAARREAAAAPLPPGRR